MQDKSRQNKSQPFIKYPENISVEDLKLSLIHI